MRFAIGCVLVFGVMLAGGCQTTLDRAPVKCAHSVPEWEESFNNVYRDGRFYFSGLSGEAGLGLADSVGVTTVIDLRTDGELEKDVDEEAKAVGALGMSYVRIPMSGKSFSAADVDEFARVLGETRGKVLVHCASSNRAGAMWSAYLHRERGMEQREALERGRAAGMWKEGAVGMAERVMGEG